jgi:D-3-phosphoglycerate dehydrogenase / 2-oxoglutarate reductase
MSRFNVVIADNRYAAYEEEKAVLAPLDARIEIFSSSSAAEARRVFAEADALLVNLFPVTDDIIESLGKCRIISRYGVGYDNVDVPAATRRGIWVACVPDYCFEDVADHALALLLGCMRGIASKDRMIRQGKWNLFREHPVHRIAGRTLGILGYGKSGRALRRRIGGLGFSRVLACDPKLSIATNTDTGITPVDFVTLLSESDCLSIHVPLNAQTRHLIGKTELARMRPGTILVNTSRGPVLDETALNEALRDGRLGGAGLDVFETEPLPAESPLRSFDSVILTDHAAWYSEESLTELKTKAAKNAAAVLAGGAPLYPDNSPERP